MVGRDYSAERRSQTSRAIQSDKSSNYWASHSLRSCAIRHRSRVVS